MDLAQFDGLIATTSVEVPVSQGDESAIHPDGDVTVAFWNDTKAAFVDAATLDSTGGVVTCPHSRMRLTTDADVYVRVVKVPRH